VQRLTGDLLYERFGLPLVFSVGCRNWLSRALAELGQFEEGARLGEEALQIAETANHPFSIAVACWALGHLYLRHGDLPEAVARLEQGIELCRRWTIPVWFPRLASALGLARALSGHAEEAVALLEQGVESGARGGAGDRSAGLVALAEGYLITGRSGQARSFVDRALEFARAQRDRGGEAWALRLRGEIALRTVPVDAVAAEEALGHAVLMAEELGMRPLVAHCRLALARLGARTGQGARAEDELAAARQIYAELGMTFWLKRAAEDLAA